MAEGSKPVVFLDRDGTINEDVGYLSDPEGLIVIEGAGKAIARLNGCGIKVIIVTNQSGVGRGYYTHEDVDAVNRRLLSLLSRDGASVDGVYYCPHYPGDTDCECRKPKAGMAMKAAVDHDLDGGPSYVVGDKSTDIELAGTIGAKGVLVLTGKGEKEAQSLSRPADFIAKDLAEAVEWIIGDLRGKP